MTSIRALVTGALLALAAATPPAQAAVPNCVDAPTIGHIVCADDDTLCVFLYHPSFMWQCPPKP